MFAYIGNDYYEKKGATGTFVVGFSGSSVTAGHGAYAFYALSCLISFFLIIFSCMCVCDGGEGMDSRRECSESGDSDRSSKNHC